MRAIANGLRAFGHFWFNFLIGDTPEVFIGSLVVIGAAVALRHHQGAGIAAVIVLTVVLLAGSVYRGRKRIA